VSTVAGEAGIAASAPDRGPNPVGRPRLDHSGEITAGDPGRVVCFMAPATFLTSLGLIEAAMTRTIAIVSPDGRSRYLRQLKNRGIAEGLELYCSHDLFFNHRNLLILNCSAQPILATSARTDRILGQCLTIVRRCPTL
jgi:hypothetical protein